jgi:ABC-type sugar transport system ATPase subunit
MTLGGTGNFALTGIIDIIERLGESGFAHVRLPSGQTIIAEVRGDPRTGSGQSAKLTFNAENLHIFNAEGQRLD